MGVSNYPSTPPSCVCAYATHGATHTICRSLMASTSAVVCCSLHCLQLRRDVHLSFLPLLLHFYVLPPFCMPPRPYLILVSHLLQFALPYCDPPQSAIVYKYAINHLYASSDNSLWVLYFTLPPSVQSDSAWTLGLRVLSELSKCCPSTVRALSELSDQTILKVFQLWNYTILKHCLSKVRVQS